MTAISRRPIRLGHLSIGALPIQAPLYRRLAADPRLEFTAIFASDAGVVPADVGYSRPVAWDADILSGYRSRFLRRAGRNRQFDTPLAVRDLDVVPLVLRSRFEVLWLHGYNYLTHMLAALSQRFAGGPILFREVNTLLDPESDLKRFVKRALLRFLLGVSARGLYIGTENRRYLEALGFSSARLFFAPYVVENDRLLAEREKLRPAREALRSQLGVGGDGGPVILFVGRLAAMKQPLVLLEAFARIRRERPCQLLIVGTGPLEGELKARISRDGIPDVTLAGFLNRSEVSRAFVAADVFALPSAFNETFGLVIGEAMNFGLPVVTTTRVGCAADLVQEGINGHVIEAEDPGRLAGCLAGLVDDPARRRAFGEASQRIISEWTYDRTVAGIVAAVAAAVGPRRWAQAEQSG